MKNELGGQSGVGEAYLTLDAFSIDRKDIVPA